MDLAQCPRWSHSPQKTELLSANKRHAQGQCAAAADRHVHRCLFILSCVFFFNCKLEKLCAGPELHWWIETQQHFSMLCRRMLFIQRLKKLLNICFEWEKGKYLPDIMWIRGESVRAFEREEKVRILLSGAAPTGACSRHKEKHSWHTDTCTHMETVCTESQDVGSAWHAVVNSADVWHVCFHSVGFLQLPDEARGLIVLSLISGWDVP